MLVLHAVMICSKTNLEHELEFIKKVLCDNGHPLDVVQSGIHAKIAQFHKPNLLGPNKYPLYSRLPWIGEVGMRFTKQISTSISNCSFAANSHLIYSS